MAQDWFYKLLGEETGPLPFQALRELAADGHLAADDEVRTSTSSWKRADTVSELFAVGDVDEPEMATDMDLGMLLSPSADLPSLGPVRKSEKRRALDAARTAAAAPQPEWFYKLLGQQMGPATTQAVLDQIQCGSLHEDDLIRLGVRGDWQPLNKFTQFAAAAHAMRPQPEWYCRTLGQVFGPMIFSELEAMAKAGSLHADDEVRHGTTDAWARADRTRGLKFSRVTAAGNVAVAHDRTATYAPFGADAKRKEWYYEILGQPMGPISFQELSQATADGSLQLEDKACKGKAGAWMLVIDVPGLVSSEARAAHVATKIEASRPRPVAPPVIAPPAAVLAPAKTPPAPAPEEPKPISPAIPAPPRPSPAAMGGGMGSMAPPRPSMLAPPSYKAPRKSSGPAFDFGAMLGGLKNLADPKAIAAVVILVLVGGYFVAGHFGISLVGKAGKAEYLELRPMFDDAKKMFDAKVPDREWVAFTAKHKSRWEALTKQIQKKSPGSDRRTLQTMLFAARDNFPALTNRKERLNHIKSLELDMAAAEIDLGLKK